MAELKRPFIVSPSGPGNQATMSPGAPHDLRCIDLFFPFISFSSLIVWYCLGTFGLYVTACVMGNRALDPYTSNLVSTGMLTSNLLYRLQMWRIFTTLFQWSKFYSVVPGIYVILKLGLPLEFMFGKLYLLGYLTAVGLTGLALTILCYDCVAISGAVTILTALLGLALTNLLLSWHQAKNKLMTLFNLVFFCLIAFTAVANSAVSLALVGLSLLASAVIAPSFLKTTGCPNPDITTNPKVRQFMKISVPVSAVLVAASIAGAAYKVYSRGDACYL